MQRLLISSYAGLALLGPGPAAVHQPDRGTRCRLDGKMESIMKRHSMRIVRGHPLGCVTSLLTAAGILDQGPICADVKISLS
jgi:hypothetical protein